MGWGKYLFVSPSIWLFEHLQYFPFSCNNSVSKPHVCLCVGPALNTFQYLVFGWTSSVSKPHVCLCVVRTGFEHLSVFGV